MSALLHKAINRRWIFLSSSLAVAAWLAFFADKTPNDDSVLVRPTVARGIAGNNGATARPTQPRPETALTAAVRTEAKSEVAQLIARDELIPAGSDEKATADLFPSQSWTPPLPPPPPAAKPPPPMAPALPFVYLGKKLESGRWEAYLGRGEDVFIVREGITIDGIYQVKAVQPPTLTLLYLPLKQVQTMSIGGEQ